MGMMSMLLLQHVPLECTYHITLSVVMSATKKKYPSNFSPPKTRPLCIFQPPGVQPQHHNIHWRHFGYRLGSAM
jgi:hypothetical protein